MPGYVTIANLALSKLGEADRLTDPDDDTKVGREVAGAWEFARTTVLRAGKWNFATRRAALPARADLPADQIWPFASAFALPAGALRFADVIDPAVDDDYQLEGGQILANVTGPLRVRCVFDKPDPNDWDDSFIEAFACYLAWQIADSISGDRGRKLDAWSAYQTALRDAKGIDAVEQPPERHHEDPWILARLGGC